jgi:hypothetical protein
MNTIRLTATVTLVLLGLYFVLRALAFSCSGAACDAYIPVSLMIPVLILVLTALTGVLAIIRARALRRWFAALIAATLLGVAGPILALLVFRDNPDAFVLTGTILVLLAVGTALAFSFRPARSSAPG